MPSYYPSREPEIEEAPEEVIEVAPTLIEPVAEESVEVEASAAETPTASAEELGALWSTIGQILHEREAQGKPRLRATNLKDLLMARVIGFTERRYGFNKFRDLLAAAEKAGAIEVNRSGPVHWVTLPHRREEPGAEPEPMATMEKPGQAEQASAPAPAASAAQAAPVAAPAASAAVGAAPVAAPAETDPELVRFVVDLRNRSRWLTYTYVLTNMIAHLSQQIGPQQADAEARNALNRLVQQGVLRVDREPREIEVAGARHRVRMCHLEESHPLVQAVLAEEPRPEAPEAPAAEAASAPEPVPARAADPDARPPERERRQPARDARDGREPRERREHRSARQAPPRVILPFLQPSAPQSETEAQGEEMPTGHPAVEAASPAPGLPERPSTGLSPLPDALLQSSSSVGLAPMNPTGATGVTGAEAAEQAPEAPAEASPPVGAGEKTPLVRAFEALREIIEGATGPDKPYAGAASVKTRLARLLGTFDERTLGFGKFKDFLLAAQREGYVRVESSGPATRVYLPDGR